MSKKYANEENIQIAMSEYNEDIGVNNELWTQNGTFVGYTSQVYDNKHGNGEQVYAVVDNPDQKPSEVEEVTVLFRGSAGPDKVLTEDFRNDWLENDLPLALRISAKNHPNYSQNYDHSSAQLKAASKALKTIMKTYPNAKVNLYGHSLGSNGQYARANLSQKPSAVSNIMLYYKKVRRVSSFIA